MEQSQKHQANRNHWWRITSDVKSPWCFFSERTCGIFFGGLANVTYVICQCMLCNLVKIPNRLNQWENVFFVFSLMEIVDFVVQKRGVATSCRDRGFEDLGSKPNNFKAHPSQKNRWYDQVWLTFLPFMTCDHNLALAKGGMICLIWWVVKVILATGLLFIMSCSRFVSPGGSAWYCLGEAFAAVSHYPWGQWKNMTSCTNQNGIPKSQTTLVKQAPQKNISKNHGINRGINHKNQRIKPHQWLLFQWFKPSHSTPRITRMICPPTPNLLGHCVGWKNLALLKPIFGSMLLATMFDTKRTHHKFGFNSKSCVFLVAFAVTWIRGKYTICSNKEHIGKEYLPPADIQPKLHELWYQRWYAHQLRNRQWPWQLGTCLRSKMWEWGCREVLKAETIHGGICMRSLLQAQRSGYITWIFEPISSIKGLKELTRICWTKMEASRSTESKDYKICIRGMDRQDIYTPQV